MDDRAKGEQTPRRSQGPEELLRGLSHTIGDSGEGTHSSASTPTCHPKAWTVSTPASLLNPSEHCSPRQNEKPSSSEHVPALLRAPATHFFKSCHHPHYCGGCGDFGANPTSASSELIQKALLAWAGAGHFSRVTSLSGTGVMRKESLISASVTDLRRLYDSAPAPIAPGGFI